MSHLVQGHHKGRLLGPQHVDALDGLLFQAVHEVDDEDGDVAERGPAVAEVGEGFVAWGWVGESEEVGGWGVNQGYKG